MNKAIKFIGKIILILGLYLVLMFTLFSCGTYETGIHTVKAKQIIRKTYVFGKHEQHVILNNRGTYMLINQVPKGKKDSVYTFYLALDYSQNKKGVYQKICID